MHLISQAKFTFRPISIQSDVNPLIVAVVVER
jgi:hypothetical protein